MATEVVPFAQLSRAEQREHLIKMHGMTADEVRFAELESGLARAHRQDHRWHDGTDTVLVPHQHTKVSRRTKH